MDSWARSCDARVPNRSSDNTVQAIFPRKDGSRIAIRFAKRPTRISVRFPIQRKGISTPGKPLCRLASENG
jgi:hypothetical protein